MQLEKISEILKSAQNGEYFGKIQLDYLNAEIVCSTHKGTDELLKMTLGKYNAERNYPYPFYKPYSKLLSLFPLSDESDTL